MDVFKAGQLGQKNKNKELTKESSFYNTNFPKQSALIWKRDILSYILSIIRISDRQALMVILFLLFQYIVFLFNNESEEWWQSALLAPQEKNCLNTFLQPSLDRIFPDRCSFPFYANTASCSQDIKCELQFLQPMPNYFLASDTAWLLPTHLYKDSCSVKQSMR